MTDKIDPDVYTAVITVTYIIEDIGALNHADAVRNAIELYAFNQPERNISVTVFKQDDNQIEEKY